MPESAVDRLRGTSRFLKQCSFCQKNQSQVARLIPGVHDAYICNECVALFARLLNEMDSEAQAGQPKGDG